MKRLASLNLVLIMLLSMILPVKATSPSEEGATEAYILIDGKAYDACEDSGSYSSGWHYYADVNPGISQLDIHSNYSGAPIYVPCSVRINLYKSVTGAEETPAICVCGNADIFVHTVNNRIENPVILTGGEGAAAIKVSGKLSIRVLKFRSDDEETEIELIFRSGAPSIPAIQAETVDFLRSDLYAGKNEDSTVKVTEYSNESYAKFVPKPIYLTINGETYDIYGPDKTGVGWSAYGSYNSNNIAYIQLNLNGYTGEEIETDANLSIYCSETNTVTATNNVGIMSGGKLWIHPNGTGATLSVTGYNNSSALQAEAVSLDRDFDVIVGADSNTAVVADEYANESYIKLGPKHEWSKWEITTPATETLEGEQTSVCTKCNEAKTEVLPAYAKTETLTATASTTTLRLTNTMATPITVTCFMVKYSANEQMISCEPVTVTLSMGESTDLSVYHPKEEGVATVRIFVTDSETLSPTMNVWQREVGSEWTSPIVIGHLADLTGAESSAGILAKKAVDLAVKLINEAGGIAGRALEVITLDCQSDSSIAATNVRTLLKEHEVVAIIGPTQLGQKQAVAPVADAYEVPIMPYNSTPVFLTKKNEYFVSTGGGTAQIPTAMADYLYNDLNLRTIYVITQEGTAGDNYVGPLKANFEAMGGKVIEDIRISGDDMNVSQELLRVTEDADALIGWLSGTQGVNLWTNWYDLKICEKMPLFAANNTGFTDYSIWEQLSNSRPDVVEKALEIGVYAPVNWAYSVENDENEDFVSAWIKEYSEIPPGSSLPGAGYTSLLLLKTAIESIDGEITGAAVCEALQNTEVNSAEGYTAFVSGSRVVVKDVYIAKVVKLDNGDFNYEVVKTYHGVPVNGLTID